MGDVERADPVVKRWRKNTLREVYVRDDDTVVKRYWIPAGAPKSTATPWKSEHEALDRLAGLQGVPRTYGYTEEPGVDGVEVTLSREFIHGEHISQILPEDIEKLADLVSSFHMRGVVTDDASIQNFVRDEGGEIHFIDFGRAIVFDSRTPLFYYRVSREMAKLFWWTLGCDVAQCDLFRKYYFNKCGYPLLLRWLIKVFCGCSRWLRWMRKKSPLARLLKLAKSESAQWPGLKRGKYAEGGYIVNCRAADRTVLEEFIGGRRFLDVDEATRIPTHNKRYRVYGFHLPELSSEVIMKVSWLNPEYSLGRRFNIAVSQFVHDYGRRGFFGALKLQSVGVHSIEPLACWSHKKSRFSTESYFLYRKIPAVSTLKEFIENLGAEDSDLGLREELLAKMTGVIRCMIDSGLRHGDIALGNFLVLDGGMAGDSSSAYQIAVIDTDNISSRALKLPLLKSILDLSTLKRLNLPSSERVSVIKGVMGVRYRKFWWYVAEYWRRGGNRPLKTLVRLLSGKGVRPW